MPEARFLFKPCLVALCFALTVAIMPIVFSAPAFAETSAAADHNPAPTAKAGGGTLPPNNDAPTIVMDKTNHVVRVLIGGKEILTVDAGGVHVHGNIDYSGVSASGGCLDAK